jgi:hypothetical protein
MLAPPHLMKFLSYMTGITPTIALSIHSTTNHNFQDGSP